MAQLDRQQPSKVYRGTIDEVFSHRGEISPGATVELKVFEPTATGEDINEFGDKSVADLIEEVGTVKGLPTDLATNPSHMQGFGETNRRAL